MRHKPTLSPTWDQNALVLEMRGGAPWTVQMLCAARTMVLSALEWCHLPQEYSRGQWNLF